MTKIGNPNSKKLIEHSLPLDAINAASSREKSVRHGHRPRFTSGGRGDRWRRAGRCCSGNWSTIPQRGQRGSRTKNLKTANAATCTR